MEKSVGRKTNTINVKGDNKMVIQQGDVLIESVNEIPNEAKDAEVKNGSIVLADGETTGHAHRISWISGITFKEHNGMYYLVNKEELTVKHEEHKPVTIPQGTWKIRKVREYDHFEMESRDVRD